MNYYPFHLGDYASHTAHLELIEDLAYRRMLDAYYLREGPLPPEVGDVARLIRMRAHQAEVEAVLREFFELSVEGWRHFRCDEEIARMQDKQAKAKASAAASVNARRAKAERSPSERTANAERTLNDRSTDVELPTPTPTPTPTPKKEEGTRKRAPSFDAAAIELPEWVDREAWASWCADRKKRGKPITEAASRLQIKQLGEYLAAGHLPEAVIEHSIASGYQGLFPPKGVAPAAPGKPAESFRERDERLARERVAAFIGAEPAQHNQPDAFDMADNVIDMPTPTQRRIAQ